MIKSIFSSHIVICIRSDSFAYIKQKSKNHAGVVKHFLYTPSFANKEDMRRGIKGWGRAVAERPELSPHYEKSKCNFNGRTTWCSCCKGFSCQLNKVEMHKFSGTLQFIETMHEFPDSIRPRFNMHHFFTVEEIEHFLQNFTVAARWAENKPIAIKGLNVQMSWPRQIAAEMDLYSVRRWDQRNKRNFLQKAWDGLLRPYMFEKLDDDAEVLYENFEHDMDQIDDPLSSSSETSLSSVPNARVSFFANTDERTGFNAGPPPELNEGPFTDTEDEDDFFEVDCKEPAWNDPRWRYELEQKIVAKENALQVIIGYVITVVTTQNLYLLQKYLVQYKY